MWHDFLIDRCIYFFNRVLAIELSGDKIFREITSCFIKFSLVFLYKIFFGFPLYIFLRVFLYTIFWGFSFRKLIQFFLQLAPFRVCRKILRAQMAQSRSDYLSFNSGREFLLPPPTIWACRRRIFFWNSGFCSNRATPDGFTLSPPRFRSPRPLKVNTEYDNIVDARQIVCLRKTKTAVKKTLFCCGY